jgi:CheY-like chemotaxis protein
MNEIANRMLNVLLIDDDEVDIMNVERAIKKANLPTHLYIANNGIEALKMLRREIPSEIPGEIPSEKLSNSVEDSLSDISNNLVNNQSNPKKRSDRYSPILPSQRLLILLDLNMPQMNGIEFLEELRADSKLKKTPVVVLTTSNADQDRIDAYNSNVAGYLLKPISFSVFVQQMITLNNYWTSCEMP